MCGSTVDIQSATAENRRGKKKEKERKKKKERTRKKKPQDANNGLPYTIQSGHNKYLCED